MRYIVWRRAGEYSIINRGRVGGYGTESPIKEVRMGSLVMLRISGCVSPNYTCGCISAPIGSSQRVGLLGVGAAFKPNFYNDGPFVLQALFVPLGFPLFTGSV